LILHIDISSDGVLFKPQEGKRRRNTLKSKISNALEAVLSLVGCLAFIGVVYLFIFGLVAGMDWVRQNSWWEMVTFSSLLRLFCLLAVIGFIIGITRLIVRRAEIPLGTIFIGPGTAALSVIALWMSKASRDAAIDDYAKPYIGSGFQPGIGFDLLCILFLVIALLVLFGGFAMAGGFDIGSVSDPCDSPDKTD